MSPRLTVIIPAPGGIDSVRAVIDSWRAQGGPDLLTVMVLCPPPAVPTGDGIEVVDTNGLRLHQARAAGVRAAGTELVVIAEDHCVPDPGWVDHVLACVDDGWEVVVPSLRPAGPPTRAAQASFLLGYGQWMRPLAAGPADMIPGHNFAVVRERLLAVGSELEELLLAGAFLARRLARTSPAYLEPAAGMRHVDPPGLARQLRMFVAVGAAFGAARTRRWRRPARLAYVLAVLPVAVAHWRRALVHYRRAGRRAGFGPGTLATAALLACAWGCSEGLGAMLGPRRVAAFAWRSEIKPATAVDLSRTAVDP